MPDLLTTDECPAWLATQAGTSLPGLISAASRLFQRRCHRELVLATRTEIKNGTNRSRIWLQEPPILAVTAVNIEGSDLDNTNGDAWTFDPATGELWQGDGFNFNRFRRWWPYGLQNISVTYTGGYPAFEIPDDVKEAVVQTIKFFLDSRKAVGIYKSESIGSYSYTLNDLRGMVMPQMAAAIADSYNLTVVG